MNEKEIKSISKFLSLILRHSPETINLKLDENGWADVEELITKSNKNRKALDFETLQYVVENNDKKRFSFNEDLTKIRANQGHSITIDLELQPQTPPDELYHGTVAKFMDTILKEGLQKMNRQHVHLSKDKETAIKVGNRRGGAIILKINTHQMTKDGYLFYCSDNDVWLTDEVPPKYIQRC
ncbi:RNA 2'-phosphotransferase [Flavobacterium covae]|uniref:Probable RNA 2'-phosphotransferase n=1 Tax=Flavobacterium covae TaxID=2906076 RepID=A0ABW8PIH3_9FLAO|nr:MULTISPECIES: RNA 2'-phosphotransferase [Flavobacterium]OWP81271.1 RNA 2'-phosphotransferase [Flavobacterium covae]POR22564.1 RNA 2'-phosphotransferase [Flavobacterium columnare]